MAGDNLIETTINPDVVSVAVSETIKESFTNVTP